MSWSMNCPHCMNMWVIDLELISLSQWNDALINLGLGNEPPLTDSLTASKPIE